MVGFSLAWKERLRNEDVEFVEQSIAAYEQGQLDEDELREELDCSELYPDEVEKIIESVV